jgi:hypothetical protein
MRQLATKMRATCGYTGKGVQGYKGGVHGYKGIRVLTAAPPPARPEPSPPSPTRRRLITAALRSSRFSACCSRANLPSSSSAGVALLISSCLRAVTRCTDCPRQSQHIQMHVPFRVLSDIPVRTRVDSYGSRLRQAHRRQITRVR